jgi:hypothetical protein
MIDLLEGKWVKKEMGHLSQRSLYNLNLLRMLEKGKAHQFLIILLVYKDLTHMKAFILRTIIIIIINLINLIIPLILEEEGIMLIIMVCTEEEEDHPHLLHTLILMRLIPTTMETPGVLRITFEVRIRIIITKCHPCLTMVNRVPMVDQMVTTVIHRICLDALDLLLLDITPVDTVVHILALRLLSDTIQVDLLHRRTIIPIKHLIRILSLHLGVRDQTSRNRQMDLERNEQSRVLMIGAKIIRFPYLIPSEEQIAVLVTVIVLPQLVKLQISLRQNHQISVIDHRHEHRVIYLLWLDLQQISSKVSSQLIEGQILVTRLPQV